MNFDFSAAVIFSRANFSLKPAADKRGVTEAERIEFAARVGKMDR